MAGSDRSTARSGRRTAGRASVSRQNAYYTEGNAARKLSEMPERRRAMAGNTRTVHPDRIQSRPSASRTGRAQTRSAQTKNSQSRNRQVRRSASSSAVRRQGYARTERTYAQAAAVPAKEVSLSAQARKNQEKALKTNRGFVIFLTLAMVAVMGCCVNYIRLKSEYTAKMGTVASLEAELAQIKEDNDAYYSQVTSNVDLARIKKIAIGRLGMKYPSDNQMASYTTSEGSGYVRQYQDLPE